MSSVGTSPHAIGDMRLGGYVLAPNGWFGAIYANVVYDMNLEPNTATPIYQRPALYS